MRPATLLLCILVACVFTYGLVIVDLQNADTLSGSEQLEVAANDPSVGGSW